MTTPATKPSHTPCGFCGTELDRLGACPLHDAAPDLLAALETLTRAVNVPGLDPLVVFASIERAREAIRKATGQEG